MRINSNKTIQEESESNTGTDATPQRVGSSGHKTPFDLYILEKISSATQRQNADYDSDDKSDKEILEEESEIEQSEQRQEEDSLINKGHEYDLNDIVEVKTNYGIVFAPR